MSDFTYELPDPHAFLYTLRRYLEASGHEQVAALLTMATCSLVPSNTASGAHWDAFWTELRLHVPVDHLPKFTKEVRELLREAADKICPPDSGFDIRYCRISPLLEAPPPEEQPPLNVGALGSAGSIEHDGLRFRSRTETRIYDVLKNRNVLFFPNATAVLGGQGLRREPDFLICQNGRWGILEVMGEPYHPANTAMRDHDRARLFKDYGVHYVDFYEASRCYTKPNEVVDDFLKRLAHN